MSSFEYVQPERLEKIKNVAKSRQHDFTLVLENIHDEHNVAAIFRTCDAVGISKIHLLYNLEKLPKISKKISASGFKWVDRVKHKKAETCIDVLKSEGYTIYSSTLVPGAKNLYDLKFEGKTAIVLGNEHRGISDEVVKASDETFFIPMYGFVQSLNVSVAAAIILYEVLRRKQTEGKYDTSSLSEDDFNELVAHFVHKR